MSIDDELSSEQKREVGKFCFFHNNGDPELKNYGLRLIVEAHRSNDPEATFLVAKLLLDGILRASVKNPDEHALSLMCTAANNGCIQARSYLNAYCEERYQKEYDNFSGVQHEVGALVDFAGKTIKISRQGVFTPVDAVLEYKDGINVLTLKTNVVFLYDENICRTQLLEDAVYRGMLAWEGEYEVFGGQKLSVRVVLTNDDNIFDNIYIMPITTEIGSVIQNMSNMIGTKERKAQIADMVTNKRSFAASGLKWSVNSRKIIGIQSVNGKFDDYDEIMHVVKHEFGHVLGLGDLYASSVDNLAGVKKGTYDELDCYAINDGYYNLVMCDHHGPISNNDIEMIVLAFRENKMQLYQPSKLKGRISSALGKGN